MAMLNRVKEEKRFDADGKLVCIDYLFECNACKRGHVFTTNRSDGKRPWWTFSGSLARPTFHPSLFYDKGGPSACHCVVTDGRISYLSDSAHSMAGHTVDLPDILDDEDTGEYPAYVPDKDK